MHYYVCFVIGNSTVNFYECYVEKVIKNASLDMQELRNNRIKVNLTGLEFSYIF